MVGLGRMGFGMAERLLKNKIRVVVYNRSVDKIKKIVGKGAVGSVSLEDLVKKLPSGKKIVWLMLPAGEVTEQTIRVLLKLLRPGDIIVDGANDFYGVAEKHSALCSQQGIHFFDCGVSGGVWGLKNGFTLMVGGAKGQFKFIEPICKALAPRGGYAYFGPAGAGHFVKSVHNIIEYVYLQGLAEGVELLRRFKQPIDLAKVTTVWEPASVIRSWLLGLTTTALRRSDFKKISAKIDSVTIDELQKTVRSVEGYAPAFGAAVKIRRDKSQQFVFGKRTIAAVRREFGGHAVVKKK